MFTSKLTILGFFCGLMCGIGVAVTVVYYAFAEVQDPRSGLAIAPAVNSVTNTMGDAKVSEGAPPRRTIKHFLRNSKRTTTSKPALEHGFKDDNTTAKQLYEKVRVLCWVMTSPKTLYTKALHLRNTWTSRCNVRLFMSSANDTDFPAIGLPVEEGRDHLYDKTKAAFKYAWKHYKDEVDWFLKADDDTFVILENLRYLLKDYDANEPIYFGRKFKPYVDQGYMSGGAGYVLSKEATNRFVEAVSDSSIEVCDQGGAEDVAVGKCMSFVDVIAGDSRDYKNRERFHPFVPAHHVVEKKPDKEFWYWKFNYYPTCQGRNCSSEFPISFHYVGSDLMYVLEYLAYEVKVFGMAHQYQQYSKLPYEV